MKVLIGPRVELAADPEAAVVCGRLAGEDGQVVSLADLSVKNLYRQLSPAEIEAIRVQLRQVRTEAGVVGYVCRGVGIQPQQAGLVVVTDHANLTWRSPLVGPNDERDGPRFPGLDRAYAPEVALERVSGSDGMIVAHGVVAGVQDDRAMSEYETDTVRRHGWVAASSELVAPVIIAAHMGLRVAAVVITA
jgi:purine-nucleoside phosphorylase